MAVRRANAVWTGSLKEGNGSFRVGSGALSGTYSFGTRFEEQPGTSPEELIGAAHASCFSMALSAALGKAGFTPQSIATDAIVHLGKIDDAPAIVKIELHCVGVVPGIDPAQFVAHAEGAKKNCPLSKALAAVPEIVLEARLG